MKLSDISSKGKAFEILPAEGYPARFIRIVDLGHQWNDYSKDAKEHKWERKLMIWWEVSEPMASGKPFAISKMYTASCHEKSAIMIMIGKIQGQPLNKQERMDFEVSSLLGNECMLDVINTTKTNGDVAAKINGVGPLPKAMRAGLLDQVNESFFFSIDDREDAEKLGKTWGYDRYFLRKAKEVVEDGTVIPDTKKAEVEDDDEDTPFD